MSVLLILTVNIPVYATEIDYVSRDSFWNWIAGSNGIAQKVVGFLSFSGTCAQSEDSYHHASSYEYDTGDGHYGCVCIYCGKVFTAYASDLSSAYDDYVETLPATGYNSSGCLLWSPSHRFSQAGFTRGSTYYVYCEHKGGEANGEVSSRFSYRFDCSNSVVCLMPLSGSKTFSYLSSCIYFEGSAPIDGYYSIVAGTPSVSGYYVDSDGVRHSVNENWTGSALSTYYSAGALISCSNAAPVKTGIPGIPASISCQLVAYQGIPPVYEITPVSSFSGNTYNINTRPTSITGGNYGIVGDNGQITKVEDNSTIINETNNTFYNPATGQTVPIVNWSYDYSDRSYKVTLESGDTATITYGDENITISQITTTEGDTITNNYTIYYLIDGSGSGSGEICAHEWTETSTTPATCTLPGSKLLTCSKCQQTKTETLPALGHDWQVKRTVTTQYDDTGQLIQEGYTIYECSRCKEQYKSAPGTSPPTNPSDPDASGEGVFSGIFGLLLDFLSFFWKTFKDFTKSGVKAFLDALRDGTSDIFGLLNPFDWSA